MSKKKNRKQRRKEQFDPALQQYYQDQKNKSKSKTVLEQSNNDSKDDIKNNKKESTKIKQTKKNHTNFFKSVAVELKKVNWLTTDQLLKSTGVVFIVVAIFTLVTFAEDTSFGLLFNSLLNL